MRASAVRCAAGGSPSVDVVECLTVGVDFAADGLVLSASALLASAALSAPPCCPWGAAGVQ